MLKSNNTVFIFVIIYLIYIRKVFQKTNIGTKISEKLTLKNFAYLLWKEAKAVLLFYQIQKNTCFVYATFHLPYFCLIEHPFFL